MKQFQSAILITGFILSFSLSGPDHLSAQCDSAYISSKLGQASVASPDSAEGLYQDAIGLIKGCLGRSGHRSQKFLQQKLVRAYSGLGMMYFRDLRYDMALRNFTPALAVAREMGSPSETAECLFNLAELNLEQSRFKDAMDKYGEAMEQYRLARDASGQFWCYTGMGIVQKQMGNFDDAVICYKNALVVTQKYGLKNEAASCYNNLGNVYRKKGDFLKAMESYEKAILHFKSLRDNIAVSDCQNNIGNLYLDNGDPFRALNYYNQSLKIVKAAKDEYRLIIRYKNMADAYSDLKDYDNAAQFLDDAMTLALKSGDKSFLASCYMQSGELQALRKEPEIALAYYQKAASMFEQIGSKSDQADALVEIAKIELQKENISASIGHAANANELSGYTGTLKTQLEASLCLAEGYERKGDQGQAIRYLRKSLLLKDSIYSAEKYRSIEEIEAGFVQHELKEKNSTLSQDSQLQKQAIRTRNIILLLLAVCLILSISLIWIVFKRQKAARREAGLLRQLSEQKIEKLNEDLTAKERELTSKTIFINQKNQILERVIDELENLRKDGSNGNEIQHLQVRLKQELSPNTWKEFEVQFNEVHPGFQNRLLEKYPELSPAERRLCTFIRLDMNTREISSLTGQSIKSIEVARTRIRRKLMIPHENNLTNFIAKF